MNKIKQLYHKNRIKKLILNELRYNNKDINDVLYKISLKGYDKILINDVYMKLIINEKLIYDEKEDKYKRSKNINLDDFIQIPLEEFGILFFILILPVFLIYEAIKSIFKKNK